MNYHSIGGFTLEALIALAGIFLGLAIAVQALQEIYKYLTCSKARAYRIALRDFLGDWVDKADGCEALRSMYVRGPFDLVKDLWRKLWNLRQESTPIGLLPLKKEELLHAVDRTTPEWIRGVIDTLKKERDVQQRTPAPPSPILRELIEGSRKHYDSDGPARKTFDFLKKWEVVGQSQEGAAEPPCDAARVLEAFYQRYVPERAKVRDEFERFTDNFDHAYQRRNLRLTVILATLLALVCGLPFTALYDHARSLAPEEAIRLTQSLTELYDESQADTKKAEIQDLLDELEKTLEKQEVDLGVKRLTNLHRREIPGYLGGCLLTALLIAFGAPFWDRLSSALLSVHKAGRAAPGPDGETQP